MGLSVLAGIGIHLVTQGVTSMTTNVLAGSLIPTAAGALASVFGSTKVGREPVPEPKLYVEDQSLKWYQTVKLSEQGYEWDVVSSLFRRDRQEGIEKSNLFNVTNAWRDSTFDNDYLSGIKTFFGPNSMTYRKILDVNPNVAKQFKISFEQSGFHEGSKADAFLAAWQNTGNWVQATGYLRNCINLAQETLIDQISSDSIDPFQRAGGNCSPSLPTPFQLLGTSTLEKAPYYPSGIKLVQKFTNSLGWKTPYKVSELHELDPTGEPYAFSSKRVVGRTLVDRRSILADNIVKMDLSFKISSHTAQVMVKHLPRDDLEPKNKKLRPQWTFVETEDFVLGKTKMSDKELKALKERKDEEGRLEKEREARKAKTKRWHIINWLYKTIVTIAAAGLVPGFAMVLGQAVGDAGTSLVTTTLSNRLFGFSSWFKNEKGGYDEGFEKGEPLRYALKSGIEWTLSSLRKGLYFPTKMAFWGVVSEAAITQTLIASVLASLPESTLISYVTIPNAIATALLYSSFSLIKENCLRKTVLDLNREAAKNSMELMSFSAKEGTAFSWLNPRFIFRALYAESNLIPLSMFLVSYLAEDNAWRTHNLLQLRGYEGMPVRQWTSPPSQFSMGQQYSIESGFGQYLPAGCWSLVPAMFLLSKNLLLAYQNNTFNGQNMLLQIQNMSSTASIVRDENWYRASFGGWGIMGRLAGGSFMIDELADLRASLTRMRELKGELELTKDNLDSNSRTKHEKNLKKLEKEVEEYDRLELSIIAALDSRDDKVKFCNEILNTVGNAWMVGFFIQITKRTYSFDDLPTWEEMNRGISEADFSSPDPQGVDFLLNARKFSRNPLPFQPNPAGNFSSDPYAETLERIRTSLNEGVREGTPSYMNNREEFAFNSYLASTERLTAFSVRENATVTDVNLPDLTSDIMEVVKWFPHICSNHALSFAIFGTLALPETWERFQTLIPVIRRWTDYVVGARTEENERTTLNETENTSIIQEEKSKKKNK